MNNYIISYKNGNVLKMKAYSVEEDSEHFYVCGKSYAFDNPEYYILTKKHILSIVKESEK